MGYRLSTDEELSEGVPIPRSVADGLDKLLFDTIGLPKKQQSQRLNDYVKSYESQPYYTNLIKFAEIRFAIRNCLEHGLQ